MLQMQAVQDKKFVICKLSPDEKIPSWLTEKPGFFTITRAHDELSIVCEEQLVPADFSGEVSKYWCCIEVLGPLDLNQKGVLSSISAPLSVAQISLFAISTYNTDYLFVKEEQFAKAKEVLGQTFILF